MHTSVNTTRLITNSLRSQQDSSIRYCWCSCLTSNQHSYHYHSNWFVTISSQLLTTSTINSNVNLFITRPVIIGLLSPAHKCDTIFRNVRKYLPIRTKSDHRKRESSVHNSLYSRHKNCVFSEEVNGDFRTVCRAYLIYVCQYTCYWQRIYDRACRLYYDVGLYCFVRT